MIGLKAQLGESDDIWTLRRSEFAMDALKANANAANARFTTRKGFDRARFTISMSQKGSDTCNKADGMMCVSEYWQAPFTR